MNSMPRRDAVAKMASRWGDVVSMCMAFDHRGNEVRALAKIDRAASKDGVEIRAAADVALARQHHPQQVPSPESARRPGPTPRLWRPTQTSPNLALSSDGTHSSVSVGVISSRACRLVARRDICGEFASTRDCIQGGSASPVPGAASPQVLAAARACAPVASSRL